GLCVGGDADGDTISTADEATPDTDNDEDGDGIPNAEDTDSDGDTILDIDEAGDADCATPPVDTDRDGIPDFLDLDSNGDGTPDALEGMEDLDGDGIPDRNDPDIDGDGIDNGDELGEAGEAVDTDGDGVPDLRDLDSDGDTILDADERLLDPDGDGEPAFRDLDSDNDGIDDAVEAGDGDVETPPVTCTREVDPTDPTNPGALRSDGFPDFVDIDQDNDGASDAEEVEFGTDLCGVDTDGDGFSDVAEIALERINCPDRVSGEFCGCATQSACGIPADDFFLVLPFNGRPQEEDLDFATDIRVADVFFLTDTTGSMGGTIANVKSAVTTPGTGIIDRVVEVIPDAWFGGGKHDDFPFASYGSAGRDEAFLLAIAMTPPDRRTDVQTAFDAIAQGAGADGPESHTEALFQIMTGAGADWTHSSGTSYSVRRYVGDCLDSGFGAPCFRPGALPIVVHFTDICGHEGPPGETATCDPYTGITPSPATWAEAVDEMNARGAKYVGINASRGAGCEPPYDPSGFSPCFYLARTAEATGSIDLDGNFLVFDLPNESTSADFVDGVVGGIETVATRVPLDVDTQVRSDGGTVDTRSFVKRRQPACRADPPTDPCWTPPADIEADQAIAAIDESTFFGVIPGTSVKFRVTFRNDFVEGGDTAQLFIAFIDVRGGGSTVLDTRQVFIIVPATSNLPI
ncbi:MAG: hypothetical protein AAF447_14865, partial [Myxococcota bacterium]